MPDTSVSKSNQQQLPESTFPLRKQPVTVGNPSVKAVQERVALATIWIPFIGTIFAVGTAIAWGIGPGEVGLLVGMYILTNLGIEFGFHRSLAHKAFESSPFIRNLFAVLGSMAAEGSVLYWVATHRRHHVHSDTADDPHSPYIRIIDKKEDSLGLLRGLWHSHVSWMVTDDITNCTLFAKDLAKNPTLAKISELYFPIVILGLAIPAIIGGILEGSWIGIVNGFLWGGLVRMFLVHHSTWSNGSFAHRYGTRPFNTGDLSANNIWVAIPTFGASWQNNHHAFPNAAYLGLKWWQIDIVAWVIHVFAMFGLVWDVKQVTPQMMREKIKV